MSSAIRKVIWTSTPYLVRSNAVQAAMMSQSTAASQAKWAKLGDKYSKNFQHYLDLEKDAHQIYLNTTGDTLHVNLENVSSTLQTELFDKFNPFAKPIEKLEKIPNIRFNSVTEEVYRHKLYMPFRKLGYDCTFTRYNGDRGFASFHLQDTENKAKRYHYRSRLLKRSS